MRRVTRHTLPLGKWRMAEIIFSGKILVAGYSSSGSDYDVLVVRFSANGTLDTDFGTDGSLTFDGGWGDDYGYSMVLQPDGSILVAGTDYNGTDDDVLLMWVK